MIMTLVAQLEFYPEHWLELFHMKSYCRGVLHPFLDHLVAQKRYPHRLPTHWASLNSGGMTS